MALRSLDERGNMEGAAAFAAFVPAEHRVAVTRAAVAFQTAYNYLDLLSEQPSAAPGVQARSLHHALTVAVSPGLRHADYYRDSRCREDADYLERIVERCRESLAELPSVGLVGDAIAAAAARIVEFQSRLGGQSEDGASLAGWAAAATPPGCGLRWWESAAAAGSSLGVFALIAAAAEEDLSAGEARAIERAYFPWVGALHSLLDSVIDVAEDAASGQHSLFAGYAAHAEAKARMGMLARRSRQQALSSRHGERHLVVLAGMAGMYLSHPQARTLQLGPVRQAVVSEIGGLARLALLVFALRRAFASGRTWVSRARHRRHVGAGRSWSELREQVALSTAGPGGSELPSGSAVERGQRLILDA